MAVEGRQVGLGQFPERPGLDQEVQVAEDGPEVRVFPHLQRPVVLVDLEELEGPRPGGLPHLPGLDEDLHLDHPVVRQFLELLVGVNRRQLLTGAFHLGL